jgi:hypothetical protein
MPSFSQVLDGVAQAWRERRDEVERAGSGLARQIASELAGVATAGEVELSDGLLDAAMLALERSFDASNGGWGDAPKFPQPMTIEFLLRLHVHTSDARPLAMARRSLDAMAAGGIYDQLGGGFARYATDARWLVPHFEKMLYDNALLARVYVHAWQLTRDDHYRAVAEETLSFAERELLTADGAFAASLDADTDGDEGATYVWSAAEVEAALGADAALFMRAYGVSPQGNWEGRNILSRVAPLLSDEDEETLRAARKRLLEVRSRRAQPARDDKVLTAWNGLMIAALADAAAAFDEPRWSDLAARAATLLLERARDPNGRLARSWKDGRARHAAVLEDYANLADGLLALYEATFEERWFVAARDLADDVLERFADPAGGFFDTADDHETLIARPKGLQDNAVPSGGAMTASVLLRMAALTGESRYEDAARSAIAPVVPYAQRYPTAFAQWLNAIAFVLADPVEIAISGPPSTADTLDLLAVVRGEYRPFAVLAAGASEDSEVPLLRERPQRDGRATAYVCRHFACRAPVVEPSDLAAQLASGP